MPALRQSLGATAHKLLGLVGQRRYKRFFVLTRSRTGSNLLVNFLNSHHAIYCENEIFQHLGDQSPESRLRQVYTREPFYIRAKGFKIFYYHPLDNPDSSLWQHLIDDRDIAVIHLKRRNILRTVVSREIAGYQDVWHTHHPTSPLAAHDKQVTLSIEKTAHLLSRTRHWEELATRQFRHHKVLELHYEELVKHTDSQWRKVTDFLGVDYKHPQTALRRQNPESLRELITNYNEMRGAFAGTEWESMLED